MMMMNTCMQFKSNPGKLYIVGWMLSSFCELGFGVVLDSNKLHTTVARK